MVAIEFLMSPVELKALWPYCSLSSLLLHPPKGRHLIWMGLFDSPLKAYRDHSVDKDFLGLKMFRALGSISE